MVDGFYLGCGSAYRPLNFHCRSAMLVNSVVSGCGFASGQKTGTVLCVGRVGSDAAGIGAGGVRGVDPCAFLAPVKGDLCNDCCIPRVLSSHPRMYADHNIGSRRRRRIDVVAACALFLPGGCL